MLLAQAFRERMTSVGCRHPDRIYVFTRVFLTVKNPLISATAIQLTPELQLHVYSGEVEERLSGLFVVAGARR